MRVIDKVKVLNFIIIKSFLFVGFIIEFINTDEEDVR